MNIDIKYNDELDEFSYDLTLEMRLKNYITKNFYPAYTISSLCNIYLLGGSIRDLIYARKPKDLDFVIMSKENEELLLDVIDKYNIDYTYNRFGGYKLNYKGTIIDIWCTDDLFSAIEYNVDGLLFDLTNNSLISLTFEDFLENGLRKVNKKNNIENGRVKKLVKFSDSYRSKTTKRR